MSEKTRVQLSDADRKVICELAQKHSDLTQDKLTRLVAEHLNKPDLGRSTVTGTLKHSDSAAGTMLSHQSCLGSSAT